MLENSKCRLGLRPIALKVCSYSCNHSRRALEEYAHSKISILLVPCGFVYSLNLVQSIPRVVYKYFRKPNIEERLVKREGVPKYFKIPCVLTGKFF